MTARNHHSYLCVLPQIAKIPFLAHHGETA